MKKRILYSFVLTWVSFQLHGQTNEVTSIENVSVIPMTSEVVLEKQRVLISNGSILRVEPVSSPPQYKASRTIDGTGKFLIPGLSEMHYHLRSNDIESDFKLLMANGITTVRNMGEFSGQNHMGIKNKVASGALFGPNYFTTGPYLTSRDIETESQARHVVQEHKLKGFDFLKLADNLPKNVYLELLRQGQLHGIPIIGHAQRNLPLEYSTRMKSIEHVEEFLYLTEGASDKKFSERGASELTGVAGELGTSGIYVGTTLAVFEFINECLDDERFAGFGKSALVRYLHRDQRESFLTEKNDYRKLKGRRFGDVTAKELFGSHFFWMKSFVKALADSDVKLLTGSDTYGMVIVGFSLHRELELLQEAGLRPYDILVASTVNPARYLGTHASEGTISEGKNANLVLLGKNPLTDIRNTQSIEGVVVKGKWLDKRQLEQMLTEVENAYK